MKAKPFMCGACKRSFAHEQAARDHIRDGHRHGGRVGIYQRVGYEGRNNDDDEPSMADRAVQASIDAAMGIHSDDAWLLP